MAGRVQGIRAGRAFVEIGARIDPLQRGLAAAQRRLETFGSQVRSIGRQIALIGAAGAAPFGLSTRVFATFESSMSRILALTNANSDQMAMLNAEAQRLGRTTVFTASQAAEAMSKFALAGFSVQEIMEAIGPTLDLAAAGQVDIAEAADIATKAIRSMGIATNQSGRIADVLTKAFTTANTDLFMLGEAFKYVAPVARVAGIEFEELTAAIQILSNAGIQGEMAGTALRGILITLTSPTKETAKELHRLGVNIADAEGNVRSMADIMTQFGRALEGLPDAERLRIIGTIFPNRQAAGAATLIAQGSDELVRFTEALRNAGGTGQRVATTQINNLSGAFVILKSALEGLGIVIGESLVGPMRVAIDVATRAVDSMTRWVMANQIAVVAIAAGAATMVVLGSALISIGIAAQVAAFAVGGLATIVSALVGSVAVAFAVTAALSSVFGLLSTLAGVASVAVYALAASVSLTSVAIGVLSTATIALSGVLGALGFAINLAVVGFGALYTMMGLAQAAFGLALLSIGAVTTATGAFVVVTGAASAALGILGSIATGISFALGLLGGIVYTLGAALAVLSFAVGVLSAALTVLGGVIGVLTSPIGLVIAAIAGLVLGWRQVAQVGTAAGGAMSRLADFIGEKFISLRSIVGDAIAGMRDAIAAGNIDLAAKVMWNALKVVWQEGTIELREIFTEYLTNLKLGFFEAISAMSRLWAQFAAGFTSLWEKAVNKASQGVLAIMGVFDSSLDVEAGQRNLQAQSDANLQRISDDLERQLQAIDQESNQRANELLDKEADKLRNLREALAKARMELDRSIEEARVARENAEPKPQAPGPGRIEQLQDLLAQGVDAVQSVIVQGTFTGATAHLLGGVGGGVAERTAKAAEQTARYTREIRDAARDGGVLKFT